MATTATEVPQAEVRLTEALDLSPLAHKRMVGSERFVVAYQAIGLLAGIFLGTLLAGFVPLAFIWGGWLVPTWLPLQAAHLILGIFGWGMGLATAQRRRRERFVAGIQRRGTPDSVPASYAIEPDGLRVTTPRVGYFVAWDAILEIVPSPASRRAALPSSRRPASRS